MTSRSPAPLWDKSGLCLKVRPDRSASLQLSARESSLRSLPKCSIFWDRRRRINPRNSQGRRSRRFEENCPYFLNTSFSSASVVGASRLSVTNTVSPCCSITTAPSSVVHACRPCRRSILYLGCSTGAAWAEEVFPISSAFLYLLGSERA